MNIASTLPSSASLAILIRKPDTARPATIEELAMRQRGCLSEVQVTLPYAFDVLVISQLTLGNNPHMIDHDD